MYVVYGLEDPRDHLYHYIGITNDVYKRFDQHISGDSGNIKKNGWIFECRQANIMIVMRELERVETCEEAKQREKFWIFYYLQSNHPLSNLKHAKSIQEEKAEIQKKYDRLLADNMLLETQLQILEAENEKREVQLIEERRQIHLPAEELLTVLEFRRKGQSLRDIVKNTGLSYYQVQRITAENA